MVAKNRIIVGLEVGTSKVCAIVGEVSDDGNILIIGVGQVASEGVRKGEIVNMEAATKNIHDALIQAEESADVEIRNVYACVTGGHLRCFNNRGSVVVTNEDREITDDEVRNVMLNAKAVNIPMDHVVLHAIRQRFYVDGADGIQTPVGMIGAKLEADVHVIHGVKTRLQNTIRCIKQVPLDVANIAVSSLASALAVLTPEHRQLGAVAIDIGGGTTDYIVYRDGTIQHSGVIAVGGDHLTNDIATGLKIPMNRAEALKIEHGSLDVPVTEEVLALKREVGLADREVSRTQLCQIMNLRIAETLNFVKQDLDKHKLTDYLGAGVFITGGSARLRGLERVAAEIFGLPVHIGHSHTVNGPTAAIESPAYSTAIGLIRYAQGSQRDDHKSPTSFERVAQTFHTFVSRVRAMM